MHKNLIKNISKRNEKNIVIAILIIIILFNLIAFIIPSRITINFWISYSFSLLALISQFYFFINEKIKKKIENNTFIGYSFISIDITYVIIQFIVFIISKFIDIPLWLIIILNVGIAFIFILIIIIGIMSVDYINDLEEKTKEKVGFIRKLQVEIELISSTEDDENIKNLLEKLAEKVRYSDPKSSNELYDLEKKIIDEVEKLKKSNDKKKIIEEINILLDERNKKVLYFK